MPPKQPIQTRAWGTRYDTLPTSPPTSPEIKRDEMQATSQDADMPLESKRKDEKLPHDASVFIGSLPSNVDQTELTRLLTGHLSEYTEIKNIKVIRDSKGGVCAFVQCEDAVSASAFLRSLQTKPPKPFLGRILRYEPARAFRTLLISYRVPTQVVTPDGIGRISPGTINGEVLELELPHAMRIWKPKNAKYHRICYNAEAIEVERCAQASCKDDVASWKERAVYMQPLTFDAESIVNIARLFGPLEKVSKLTENHELVKPNPNGGCTPDCYPSPHNAPRSSFMDTSCWEVKWDHRDDCVTALMALRRIPHLSVSWAHQPQHAMTEQRCSFRGHQHAQNLPRDQPRLDRFQPYASPLAFAPVLVPAPSLHGDASSGRPLPERSVFEEDGRTVLERRSIFDTDNERNWINPASSPGLGHQQQSSSDIASKETGGESPDGLANSKLDWAETEFPLAGSEFDGKVDWSAWDEPSRFEKDSGPSSITTSQSASEILVSRRTQISPLLIPGDEIPTPGLAMSPTTPRTTLSQTPVTPTSHTYDLQLPGCRAKDLDHSGHASTVVTEFDPTTLFVGGLEMYGPEAWTDEKVRLLFGRFGGLEHVRVVRPASGSTAFAFVKYNNTDSPTRAILEEHNRIYAGRPLRVQLRDANPPRSPWKQNRGRGRFSLYHPPRKAMTPHRLAGGVPRQVDVPATRCGFDTTAETHKAPLADASSVGEPIGDSQEVSPSDQHPGDTVARTSENCQAEKYREWYDTPVASSPPDSGAGSTSSTAPPTAPPLPYPIPGYYPMPWLHPYPPPGHYQMSYYAPYPGYAMPTAPVQAFATTPGSDAGGAGGGSSPPWPGLIYNAYPPYFGPPARPAMDQQGQPAAGQAPLAPSGFIQNDQGTLIPVYPPDALDQYMSGHGTNNTGGNPSASTQQGGAAPGCTSTQVLPGSTSSFSVGPQTTNNPPRLYHVPANPPWNVMPPPFVPVPPGFTGNQSVPGYGFNVASRSSENRDSASASTPSAVLSRKQASRRDVHNHHFNRSSRMFSTRNGRGHMHNQDFTGNSEGGSSSRYRDPHVVNATDWSQ